MVEKFYNTTTPLYGWDWIDEDMEEDWMNGDFIVV
jgi:hypothetical protein